MEGLDHGQNPAFKTVSYSATDFELIDYTTYYTSQYTPSWVPESHYTFSAKYGFPKISSLTGKLSRKKFDKIDTGLRETYYAGKDKRDGQASFSLLVH